jgi:hypothetical protein
MLVLTLLLFCVFYVHAADSGAWIDYPADGTATMTHYTIPDGSGLVLMLETILIHTESRIYRRMWMRRRQYCMYRSFYFSSLPLLHFSLSIRIIQHPCLVEIPHGRSFADGFWLESVLPHSYFNASHNFSARSGTAFGTRYPTLLCSTYEVKRRTLVRQMLQLDPAKHIHLQPSILSKRRQVHRDQSNRSVSALGKRLVVCRRPTLQYELTRTSVGWCSGTQTKKNPCDFVTLRA